MMKSAQLKRWLPPVLIILAGVMAYWNSFDGVFLYDDIESIRDNPHIHTLWPLSEAMSLPLWNTALTVDGRPLLSLSFALNRALFGPELWGYHLVNLLIHIGAGLLLFGIVRRTLESPSFRERYEGRSAWIALAVALIWLVHPLQTQSVTYIVQRAESLMGFFFLLTVYCAIRGFEGRGQREEGNKTSDLRPPTSLLWHTAAVAACAIGTGIKEIMFSAPLLVLLYDATFISPSLPKALSQRRWLYVGLFASWSIIFAIKYLGWSGKTSYFGGISPLRYALTQPLVLLHYLRLAVWPDPLVLSYGWQLEDQWPRIVFPAIVILGMLGVMLRGVLRRRWYGFLLAWFFLILAPTSSIAPMRQAIFEHRMYLSLAAVVMFAVIGGEYLVRRLCATPKQRFSLGFGLALAIVIALGCRTHARNTDYGDGVRFWQDNVAHSPGHPLAHLNLGHALEEAGRPLEAIPHFREALRLKPDYAEAHYNWGVALDAVGKQHEAIAHYQQALRIKPDHVRAHINLGNALLASGHPGEAAEHCREALRIKPDMPKAYNNLGNAVLALGRPREAIAHYREALRLDPCDAEAHYNWGVALDMVGEPREAIAQYQDALRINPELVNARYNLANNLLALDRPSEAIDQYEQVVRADPDHADAHNNWALALNGLGRTEEAITHGRRAVELAPANAGAHNNLGTLYLDSGRFAEALTEFEEAVRLRPDNTMAQQNLLEVRKLIKDGGGQKSEAR